MRSVPNMILNDQLLTLRTWMKSACSPFVSSSRSPRYDVYTLFCNMIVISGWFCWSDVNPVLAPTSEFYITQLFPGKNGEVIYLSERVAFEVYFEGTKEGWKNSPKESAAKQTNECNVAWTHLCSQVCFIEFYDSRLIISWMYSVTFSWITAVSQHR